MRDFSKVAPNVWKSRRFWRLPDDAARYCYLYLLTGPHANSVGCYDLDPVYACGDLRWTRAAYSKALGDLFDVDLIELDLDENTVRITNWIKFNAPTNPKHALGMLAQLDQASSAELKLHQLKDIREAAGFLDSKVLAKAIDTLSKGYRKALDTKTEIDQTEIDQTETETERETETEKERETKTETETYQKYTPGGAGAPDGAAPPSSPDQDRENKVMNLPDHLNTPFMRKRAS
jgi:hypothetical protein